MRWSTALDEQSRRAHLSLTIFCGLTAASGGAISVAKLQSILLKDFPDVLGRFPAYKDYFALSTWIALFAGVLFSLYPVALTVWLGRVFVAMSLLYLILGSAGVAKPSPIACYVCFWGTALVALATQVSAVGFYLRHTKLDGPIILALAAGMLVWATYELTTRPAAGI
jgi:hypothetical protein